MYSNRTKPTPKAGVPSNIEIIKTNIIHELDDEALEKLFIWVDEIPLSRPKKNMARDFSDGVLMAEILKYKLRTGVDLHNYAACNNVSAKENNWKMMNRYYRSPSPFHTSLSVSQMVYSVWVLAAEVIKFFLPHVVDLHNYTPTSNNRLKADNWYHLNRKVLSRMNIELAQDLVTAICSCKPHAIESVLSLVRDKIDIFLASQLQRQRAPRGRRQYDTTADTLPEADQNSRGYVPSAEGFYHDGQHQSPTTRRMYPDYTVTDPLGYHSSPGRSHPASSHMAPAGSGEMLPKGLLDEREVAIENREQTITMLQAKIQRLEQLLTLKDLRIEDLSNKLDQLTQPTFPRKAQHSQRGTGMSNRLSNQRQHGGSQPLASHSGRY